jgi:hypothetical protein
MSSVFVAWALSAGALFALALALGRTIRRGYFGILIDNRGRYSLTHLQLVLWSIVIISLISGVFWGRLFDNAGGALKFTFPDELLALFGITVGSAVTASVVKSAKDTDRPGAMAASDEQHPPRFAQIFLLEEGALADHVIDVTKFQNFWFTIILVAAYIGLAVSTIKDAESAAKIVALPGFSGNFTTLLGISHAAYIAGKLPNRPGPPALSVATRQPPSS